MDAFKDITPILKSGLDENKAQIYSYSLLGALKYISEPGRDGKEEIDC